jgi:hypothetical protein
VDVDSKPSKTTTTAPTTRGGLEARLIELNGETSYGATSVPAERVSGDASDPAHRAFGAIECMAQEFESMIPADRRMSEDLSFDWANGARGGGTKTIAATIRRAYAQGIIAERAQRNGRREFDGVVGDWCLECGAKYLDDGGIAKNQLGPDAWFDGFEGMRVRLTVEAIDAIGIGHFNKQPPPFSQADVEAFPSRIDRAAEREHVAGCDGVTMTALHCSKCAEEREATAS